MRTILIYGIHVDNIRHNLKQDVEAILMSVQICHGCEYVILFALCNLRCSAKIYRMFMGA